ncbi:MAG: cell surface protein [Bacteroidales bacterium]|nr:cell surface protein [Bacteroidales bacterium]
MTSRQLSFGFPILLASLLGQLTTACNSDNDPAEEKPQKPVVTFDNETGIYSTKVGQPLTITPIVANSTGASYLWYEGSEIVGNELTLTRAWDALGTYYLTFNVITDYYTVKEDVRVEVVELTPPLISLSLPEQGLKVMASTDYIFTPDIQHADMEGFSIEWLLNGEKVGEELSYTFNQIELGNYTITINASNVDGTATKEFTVEVVDEMPYDVRFPQQSYFQPSTDRYVLLGRPIFLTPLIDLFDDPQYTWSVNGEEVEGGLSTLRFEPSETGVYYVTVSVSEKMSRASTKALTRNVEQGAGVGSAEVKVTCLSPSEAGQLRAKTASSSAYQTAVYEYVPAPGQFINETSSTGGFTGAETTIEAANEWAFNRLDQKLFVSLGSFGGYVIVGFDHSIVANGSEYDFAIQGNAFVNSCEPGVVWVSQDTNGNGLPDDEWYELRGSETGLSSTQQDFAVTYYRPSSPGMNTPWKASNGETGVVSYLSAFHSQDYYYPAWIEADSYTLYGTCLEARNQKTDSGTWINPAYDWGYADNLGSDNIEGYPQRTGFHISNAIYPDQTLVNLQYIDFVKVQQALLAESGAIGENSCEVFSISDYSMTANEE